MNAKEFEVSIAKVDEINKVVKGVVYRPSKEFGEDGKPTDYTDSQGDWMTIEDVKKACHNFTKKMAITKGAVIDKQHNEKAGYGQVVENYIAPVDMLDIGVKEGDWVAAVEVTDDKTWGEIEKGSITGFSIGGKAVYEK